MPALDFQARLDAMDAAVLAGDFAAYRARVSLPFTLFTRSAGHRIEDEAALRVGFDAWVGMLAAQGVTDVIRTRREVSFVGEGMMTGTYETNILRGAQRIVPPFTSSVMLRDEEGIWRAVAIASGLANDQWPIMAPHVAPEEE